MSDKSKPTRAFILRADKVNDFFNAKCPTSLDSLQRIERLKNRNTNAIECESIKKA